MQDNIRHLDNQALQRKAQSLCDPVCMIPTYSRESSKERSLDNSTTFMQIINIFIFAFLPDNCLMAHFILLSM